MDGRHEPRDGAPGDASWYRVAAEVGFVVAPAGLNFVVPSTTWWLYAATDPGEVITGAGVPGFQLRPSGSRIAFEPAALRQQLPLLQLADALWRSRLDRARIQPPQPRATDPMLARLDDVELGEPGFALRAFMLRTAGLLDALRLLPAYHPPQNEAEPGYLGDMIENGLTVLLVDSSTPARHDGSG